MIFNDEEWDKIKEICKNRRSYYNRFFINKKAKGKKREILAPNDELKELQNKLLNHFLYQRFIPSVYATGFVVDRSIVDNAMAHVGAEILVTVDIKNFFPSITYDMLVDKVFFDKMKNVRERTKRKKLAKKEKTQEHLVSESKWKLTPEEEKDVRKKAELISLLVTYPYEENGGIKNALPQGAPTSPCISNIICFEMDNILSGMAERNNAVYTRYADDLTMSSSKNKKLNKLIPPIKKVVEKYGFRANERKIHVNRRSGRMYVTGLVVNDKVSYGRGRLRVLRAKLHNMKMAAKDGEIPFVDLNHYLGLAAFFNSFDENNTMGGKPISKWLMDEVYEILDIIGQVQKQKSKADTYD
jgi:RNA-directed DNA polymerase